MNMKMWKCANKKIRKYGNAKVLATLVVCIFAYLHTSTFAYCDEGPGRDYFADAAFRQEYRDAAIAIAKRKIAQDEARRQKSGVQTSFQVRERLSTGGSFSGFFVWDSAFGVLWARYVDGMPVHGTLDNFYDLQQEDGFICREYDGSGRPMWRPDHPIAYNPPILAWAEIELYRSGKSDKARLKRVYPKLVKFHECYDRNLKRPDGLYFSDTLGGGMDDLQRWPHGMSKEDMMKGGIELTKANLYPWSERLWPKWLTRIVPQHTWNRQAAWIDMSAQMAFDCLNLADIATAIGKSAEAAAWRKEHKRIADLVNKLCWDEKTGFYYDRYEGGLIMRKHAGAFWVLVAKIPTRERARRVVAVLTDPRCFGRPIPLPALSADDPNYSPLKGYWQGPVWPPTTYVAICGLRAYGENEAARKIAHDWYNGNAEYFVRMKTVVENIVPDYELIDQKRRHFGRDFCGWGALAPIAIPAEFGWRKAPDAHAAMLPMSSMAGTESVAALNDATVVAHAAVARRAAGESIVLLKNSGVLPLAKGTKVAVLGAHAEYRPGGEGSSKVKSVRTVDIPTGLAEAGLVVDPGSRDVAVYVISRRSSEGSDRGVNTFDLHGYERDGIAKAKKDGFRSIVVVFNCGGGINLRPLEDDPAIGAILWMWYPGGEGGAAVGDIMTGALNPSGRLAATLAERVADYSSAPKWQESRWYVPYEEDIFVGYRYFETIPGAKEKVVYPFGYGLSYSKWKVQVEKDLGLQTSDVASPKSEVKISVRVKNVGKVAGKRSVLCYTSLKGGKADHPAKELRAFAKTKLLAPGESQTLTLSFATKDLAYFDDEGVSGHSGSWVVDCGEYTVWVGGSVRDVVKAGSFTMKNEKVLSTPGFKLHADRLARRLRSDGTYSESPVTYPGQIEQPFLQKARTNSADKASITLFDVADGKATLDQLLDQMSFDEILTLLYGHSNQGTGGTGSIGSLAKYGISAVQTCDGPSGVRRALPSTFFPCTALLACSFDPALLREIGGVIGTEAAEVDFDLLLAPGLCIHRHPLCGRNFEYFSEDPLVSGVCAAEYVKGVQANGVGATVKHFAGNNREATRKIEKDIVSERAFREIYLRGFERAIKEADPWAVMTAYNGVNGFNCGENYGLLTGILRGEWGYRGLTMTDWSTTVPMWREIGAGNDVKMPNVLLDTQGKIKRLWGMGTEEAQFARGERGYLSVTMVRESAKRVCELVMKTRRFAREREEARRQSR